MVSCLLPDHSLPFFFLAHFLTLSLSVFFVKFLQNDNYKTVSGWQFCYDKKQWFISYLLLSKI